MTSSTSHLSTLRWHHSTLRCTHFSLGVCTVERPVCHATYPICPDFACHWKTWSKAKVLFNIPAFSRALVSVELVSRHCPPTAATCHPWHKTYAMQNQCRGLPPGTSLHKHDWGPPRPIQNTRLHRTSGRCQCRKSSGAIRLAPCGALRLHQWLGNG